MCTVRGLLLTGGRAPAETPVFERKRTGWLIVAADSGLEHAVQYSIEPDAIVGDFDSVDETLLQTRYAGITRRTYEREKDYTDTELGLEYLWEHGAGEITIIGGGGGRLDHLFGIAVLFDRDRYPRRWVTDNADVTIIDDSIEFSSNAGETVSFFPAGPDKCRMRSQGLRWELNTLQWDRGDAGISNECIKERCKVEVLSGRLLMVRALSPPPVLP